MPAVFPALGAGVLWHLRIGQDNLNACLQQQVLIRGALGPLHVRQAGVAGILQGCPVSH